MSDLDVVLAMVGAPLGKLTLGGTEKTVGLTVSGRNTAIAELYADDAAFLYNYVVGSTTAQGRIPAGGSLKVPIYVSKTIYVTQDAAYAAATLRVGCAG
jgi:hypothetical protein